MDYKKIIVQMLAELDERKLKNVYFFICGLIGKR